MSTDIDIPARFNYTRSERLGGVQILVDFENGYQASVINNQHSYGVELAVMLDGDLCYDTPVTDDVLGWLTPESLADALTQIEALPPVYKPVSA